MTSQGALVAGDAGLLEASTAQEATLATSIPSGTAALLRRTCPVVLSARDELLRFGKSGAPPAFREPRRIVRPAEVRAFTKDGTTLLVPQFSGPSATRKTARADRLPEVKLGAATSNGMHLVEPRTRLTADVQMLDTRAVTAMQTDGMLVYPAGAEEGDLVVRPTPEGPEDYVLYASKPRQEQVRYRVELGPQVASVRLVGRTVELLDSGGVPRLRMSPPTLVDGACQTFQPRVQVTGCAVDTSPRLPMRRPHPAPGASACTVHVSWAGMGVTYPATLDPAWGGTARGMLVARGEHTATKTLAGTRPVVFITGGFGGSAGDTFLDSTEIYDEIEDVFAAGPPMSTARGWHAATKLLDGRVLVVAGQNATGEVKTTELYDPEAPAPGSLTAGPPLPIDADGTALLTLDTLANGTVLAAGGSRTGPKAYVYTPGIAPAIGSWSASITMPTERMTHASIVVGNEVYLLGGVKYVAGQSGDVIPLQTVVKYTPPATITGVGDTMPGRPWAQAVLIPGATPKAFVVGGEFGAGATGVPTYANLTDLSTWMLAPTHQTGAILFPALALRTSSPVVTGGWNHATTVYSKTTLYENVGVALPGPSLVLPRFGHRMTVLTNGGLLATGGYVLDPEVTPTNTGELLLEDTCETDAQCVDTNPCTADACVGSVCHHVPKNPGSACEGSNLCTGTCSDTGACSGPPPPVGLCQVCNPATGNPVAAPVGTACSSAPSSCMTGGRCVAGGTCVESPVADGTPCGALPTNVCTGAQVCRAGVCETLSGLSGATNDHDPCTTDTCDPGRGVVNSRIPGCGIVSPPPSGPNGVETAPTSFDTATSFLTPPVGEPGGQAGVVLDPQRRAVVRGRVSLLAHDGTLSPLNQGSSVRVEVKGRPDLGFTTTTVDGHYALAVNGGDSYVLLFSDNAATHLPAQRHVTTRWNRYTVLDDVSLVTKDPTNNPVTFGGGTWGSAVGSLRGGGVGPAALMDHEIERQGIVLFPPGTTANAASGSMNVHVTEYTAFPEGIRAMPADLPATSGYTYAMELSIDGMPDSVAFNQPVSYYVRDFIGIPVGSPVPVGSYNREKSLWVAEPSGKVILITGVAAGEAVVDPASGVTFDPGELAALAGTVGTTVCGGAPPCSGKLVRYWRVRMNHFSPWDLNWGNGPPAAPWWPPPSGPAPSRPDGKSCTKEGSIIECQNRVLGEELPIPGTPYSLTYRSDRTPLANLGVTVPITDGRTFAPGTTSPARIDVVIEVAGQRHVLTRVASPVAPAFQPWDTMHWTWDRRDAFNRVVEGSAEAQITLRYVYAGVLEPTDRFADLPSPGALGTRENQEVWIERTYSVLLGSRDARSVGFGGWNLSAQGMSDVGQYHVGDGRRVLRTPATEFVAGGGIYPWNDGSDGAPALWAYLPFDVFAYDGRGRLHFASARDLYGAYGAPSLRAISPAGTLETVAGRTPGNPLAWPAGSEANEIPAVEASFDDVSSLAFDSEGGVYVGDPGYRRILYVSPPGPVRTVRLVAGMKRPDPANQATPADETVPTETPMKGLGEMVLDVEGNLLMIENQRIRRIRKVDGKIDTVAGTTAAESPGGLCRPEPAAPKETCLNPSGALALAPDGSLYFGVSGVNPGVRRLRTSGALDTVVGSSAAGSVRGGDVATNTRLGAAPGHIVVHDGQLYYSDFLFGQVRRVTSTGVVEEVVGQFVDDVAIGVRPGLPLRRLLGGNAFAISPLGRLAYVDKSTTSPAAIAELSIEQRSVIPLGDELQELDAAGRHVVTRSRLRGTVRATLGYTDGMLTSVADASSRTTTITRTPNQVVPNQVVITSPGGLSTTLALDANGYLTTVTGPDEARVSMTHQPGSGLLTSLTDKRGAQHTFTYDAEGLLVKDVSPANTPGGQVLTAGYSAGKKVVTHTTAEGRASRYEIEYAPFTGGEPLSETRAMSSVTGVSGAAVVQETSSESSTASLGRTVTQADGTLVTTEGAADGPYGAANAYVAKTTTVTGAEGAARTLIREHNRTYANNGNDQTDTTSVHGPGAPALTWTTVHSRTGNTLVTTSPALRASTTAFFPGTERVASVQLGPESGGDPVTLLPVTYTYVNGLDLVNVGRVASVTVGARTTTITYDSAGRVVSVAAPTGTVGYADFDALGRPGSITLPGGRVVTQAYDPNGNVTTVTPPSGALPGNAHGFGFTLGNKLASYTPPLVSAPAVTTYTYDRDELLKQILSPLQPALSPLITRDLVGRVTKVTEGTRERTFVYDKGHVVQEAVTGVPDTVALTRTYGRSLLMNEQQKIGTLGVNELVRGYDDLLRTTSHTLTGGPTMDVGFDADGLLNSVGGVGGLTVEHGSTVALLKRLVGPPAGWEEEIAYDGYGAPLTTTAKVAGVTKGWTLEYDAAGRIWRKTETPWGSGTAKTWTYGYDAAGRLATALVNGVTTTYDYDSNGNRFGATVDAQDRVTSQDGTEYTFDAHGNVTTRMAPAAATQTLSWDSEGGLLSVTKPGSADVAYVLDARGRRVGKKIGGPLVREWMYDGQLRVTAEVVRSPATGAATHTRVYGYVPERHLPVVMVQKEGLLTTTYRIYGDHLGSLRAVVRTDGTVMQTMEHGPWGEIAETVAGGFERVPFGFAGGLYDADTGLVRFGAREYDAGTGRWLSKDEARFGGGWNFYEYAAGDPVNLVDRTGRSATWLSPNQDYGWGPFGLFFQWYMAPTTHLCRNTRQSCPPRIDACSSSEWIRDDSGAHDHATFRGGAKWNSGYQCSYTASGDLSNDGVRRGSYDYASPSHDLLRHLGLDVLPAFVFGTGYCEDVGDSPVYPRWDPSWGPEVSAAPW